MSGNAIAIKLARSARDILVRDGWITGDLHYGGKHCALGAIEQAQIEFGKPVSDDVIGKVKIALAQIVDGTFNPEEFVEDDYGYRNETYAIEAAESRIMDFNDGQADSVEDVLRAFNNSIRRLKEGASA